MPANRIYDSYVEGLPSLSGKCVAITGCTSGTGYWCAIAAVRRGAGCVLLLNRRSDRATVAEEMIRGFVTSRRTTKIETVLCDLTSFASVRSAAAAVEKAATAYGGLSVLCCNAGVMGFRDVRTADGFDIQMQTNHLSHFLLTKLLLPSLEVAASRHGDARVVQHSSGARYLSPVGLRAKYFERCDAGSLGGDSMALGMLGGSMLRYHMTKLANACFALALHERLRARGSRVKSLVAEPGISDTHLTKRLLEANGLANRAMDWLYGILSRAMMQSAADGAAPLIGCCFADGANSGDFLMQIGRAHV